MVAANSLVFQKHTQVPNWLTEITWWDLLNDTTSTWLAVSMGN